jgi:Zn ribbon nucleic-acid-binding protein
MIFEGNCPKCNNEVEIHFYESEIYNSNTCPICGHGGWWDEEYNDDNWWMVWYWDEV